MVEQLVTFETAVLAKQAGFDEVCIDTFSPTGIETDRYDVCLPGEGYHNEELKGAFETTNSELEKVQERQGKIGNPPFIARPTQSLLHKWLMDKHNIIVIPLFCDKREFACNVIIDYKLYFSSIIRSMSNKEYYKSYEIALEEGLKIGLKKVQTKFG